MPEPLRIVILEDNPADAELIKFELEENELIFIPKVISSEKDFVSAIDEFVPDLILSDYDLPKYNGALALAESKKRCPEVPFILVTGAVSEDRAIEILTQGAKDYVLKSRLEQKLVPAIRRVLAEVEEHKARKIAELRLREAHRTLKQKVKARTAKLEAEIAARKKIEQERELLLQSVQEEKDRLSELIKSMNEREKLLRESEERFRVAFDDSAMPMSIIAPDGVMIRVNSAMCKLVGYSEQELTGHSFIYITNPEDLPNNLKALNAFNNGEINEFRMEKRYVHKDGHLIWVDLSISALRDLTGVLLYEVVQAQDITERKHAEEALHKSEERFRILVTASSDEIFSMNPDWTELRFLQGKNQIADTKTMGSSWIEKYIHPKDQPSVLAAIKEAIKNKSNFELEHSIFNGEGNLEWIFSRAVPLLDDNGNILEWFGTTSNITSRKLAEETLEKQRQQLEDANRELESFSYSVSHDLQAPLRAIEGFSRIILKRHSEFFDEETSRKFNLIISNVDQMKKLISDLLAFSRLDRMSMSMEQVDMKNLVREVWEEIIVINPNRVLTINQEEMPPCFADRSLLKQVIMNILGNAVKFSNNRDETVIEVGSQINRNNIAYYVRDNGVGFDMAYYDKLFTIFKTLHNREEHEGSGVGLAISQRIINRHGGRIWAESKLGEGSTFYFALPGFISQ